MLRQVFCHMPCTISYQYFHLSSVNDQSKTETSSFRMLMDSSSLLVRRVVSIAYIKFVIDSPSGDIQIYNLLGFSQKKGLFQLRSFYDCHMITSPLELSFLMSSIYLIGYIQHRMLINISFTGIQTRRKLQTFRQCSYNIVRCVSDSIHGPELYKQGELTLLQRAKQIFLQIAELRDALYDTNWPNWNKKNKDALRFILLLLLTPPQMSIFSLVCFDYPLILKVSKKIISCGACIYIYFIFFKAVVYSDFLLLPQ